MVMGDFLKNNAAVIYCRPVRMSKVYIILNSESEREPTCQWRVAVTRTPGQGWPYLTILSSEVSRYSLEEWNERGRKQIA